MTTNISKGYLLNKALNISDKYRHQHRELFKKNNLPYLEINLLPREDREKFYEILKKQHRLSTIMANNINQDYVPINERKLIKKKV